MRANIREAILALLFLALPVVGALIGSALVLDHHSPRHESWQPLGQPPEPALTLAINGYDLWVFTVNGQWYRRSAQSDCASECWLPAEELPGEASSPMVVSFDQCAPLPSAAGLLNMVARCEWQPLDQRLIAYGLRTDGSIWSWQHWNGSEWLLLELLIFGGAGGVIGLVVTVVIGAVLAFQELWRARRKVSGVS